MSGRPDRRTQQQATRAPVKNPDDKAAIQSLIVKISELAYASPDKVARILTDWLHRT